MATSPAAPPLSATQKKVVFATSLGTVFEWYDFYLYGALATIIARQFFSGLDDGSAYFFALLTFAAGFVVRPFGALVFGRLGDMVGRKYTFIVTILIMGLSTFIVGVVPNYASIGVAAPLILIFLRLLQGLAMGGEYGGAATYVAEYAPKGRRGAYTAWIQTTATLGLALSLLVVLGTRWLLGDHAFEDWGWRIPFLLSILLLGVSVYIRLNLSESPAFLRMKAQGRRSKAPLTESFARVNNLKTVLLALAGLTGGQAVIWYCSQLYVLFFLTQSLMVEATVATLWVAASLLLGSPFFVLFGAWSDKVGRKPIIMLGCALAAASYFPVFSALTAAANPALATAQATNQVTVTADQAECSFQLDLTGSARFSSSCDMAKQALAAASVSYTNVAGVVGTPAVIHVGGVAVSSYSVQGLSGAEARRHADTFKAMLAQALADAGYPTKADMSRVNTWGVMALLIYLVVLVAMVYGPMAAALAEMFPTRLRYTSVSLPYHIGNGWLGGLLPTIAFAVVAQTGDMYSGLWYPVIVAGATAVVGTLWLKETKDVDLDKVE
ncbi:MFS transporter [Rhodoferax sp. PAMC 29310]|uniref:MFS transporter n=1 Tax=Rhodoferax sp. PAMC 29310 TaxID=2822760 RepID=UPI001F0B4B04|nr:MFS transporter [Rhodoferax sp. PAMC 29310]